MSRPLGVAAAALVVAACGPAPNDLTLLFVGRAPTARLSNITWAPDPDRSRLVGFDGHLRIVHTLADPRLATPVAVAPLPGDRLIVTERTGEAVVIDAGSGKPVREWESPFPSSLYATGGDHIVAARSPYFVQLVAEQGSEPLLWRLDTLGRRTHGIGTIHVPAIPYLAQLVNAGAVALDPANDDAVYFAPFVRDEILRFDATGATVWRAQRGLFPEEPDPRFMPPPPGKPREVKVVHAIVNIALALTPPPDHRLYVLGAQDSGATRLRLDVLDPATGRIVTTRMLDGPQAAIAVDRRGGGAIRILDSDSLLAQAPLQGRETFGPPFALPTLAGDTVTLARYRGKVTLVNFWASWCDPCREEFPHMGALYRDFARKDFDIAAISDDVDEGKMRAFVREFGAPFPILVGGGKMKGTYHYRGLPYSVLLDRRGLIVRRLFGFGGAAEFRTLRETIAKEIRAPYP